MLAAKLVCKYFSMFTKSLVVFILICNCYLAVTKVTITVPTSLSNANQTRFQNISTEFLNTTSFELPVQSDSSKFYLIIYFSKL